MGIVRSWRGEHDNNNEIYSNVEYPKLITFTAVRCYQERRLSFYDLYLLNDCIHILWCTVEDCGLCRA